MINSTALTSQIVGVCATVLDEVLWYHMSKSVTVLYIRDLIYKTLCRNVPHWSYNHFSRAYVWFSEWTYTYFVPLSDVKIINCKCKKCVCLLRPWLATKHFSMLKRPFFINMKVGVDFSVHTLWSNLCVCTFYKWSPSSFEQIVELFKN